MNAIALAAPALGHAIEPEPAWGRLTEIKIPVQILCGTLDIPHIQARSEQLANSLPSLEQPENFTDRLVKILVDYNHIA